MKILTSLKLSLLCMLLIPNSLTAESITITSATGYFTDSLTQRKDHVVLSHNFDEKDNLRFLVVKLEYKVTFKDGNDYYSLADDDMLLKAASSNLEVKPALEMQNSGPGTQSTRYINHYKRDNGHEFTKWPVYPVSPKDKNFTLHLKGFKPIKVKIDPSLKQVKETESPIKNLKKCELMLVEPASQFNTRVKLRVGNEWHIEKTIQQASNAHFYGVSLKLEIQGRGRFFYIGFPQITLKDNTTGSIYPFICDDSYTSNPSISTNSKGLWPEAKDYTLYFIGPKVCKDISILYFGEEIARWKK